MVFCSVLFLSLLVVSSPVATQDTSELELDADRLADSFLAQQGYTVEDISARLQTAWDQLFYGDDESQRIYYPVDDDVNGEMAYMLDVNNNDVRSEGMSYGMMIAVQLDKQEEFDRLWKWAKTYLYHTDGPYKGYFAWQAAADGTRLDQGPAPDGEEWFATALFFASARWGDGEGIFNYRQEANILLRDMLITNEVRGATATSMFHPAHHMIVFVPETTAPGNFTDPSYHLPHYYELWGQWADENNDYWFEAVKVSRAFWKLTAHPTTGLMANYAKFTGEPQPWGEYGEFFSADAWRICMTVAMDYLWFKPESWHIEQSNRLLNFFYGLGIDSYTTRYRVNGEALAPFKRDPGLIATNAIAAMVATTEHAPEFIDRLWNTPIPSGQYRYYDGLLVMFALLNLSGHFTMYKPAA
jgi:oligosaccharide reducing-end xylanase